MPYIVRWPRGWHDRYRFEGVEIVAPSPCSAAEIFAKDLATQYQDCGHRFDDEAGEDLIVSVKRLPECKWKINVSNLDTKTRINTIE